MTLILYNIEYIDKKNIEQYKYKNNMTFNNIMSYIFFRDNLKLYRDMTCSTNTYSRELDQSLKEYIGKNLIKTLLHVSLVFSDFVRQNCQK